MTAPVRPRISDNPRVAANIARLAEETGIPAERYEHLVDHEPPPPGMPLDYWIDALAHRARLHGPWTEEMLQQLGRMAPEPRLCRDHAA